MGRSIGALVFPGFELLDMFGPLEMFGMLEDAPTIKMIAATMDPVASRQGPSSVVDQSFVEDTAFDILLIPGGPGTRPGVEDSSLIDWIAKASESSEVVATVCTGSALLAKTGHLDGKVATTNKAAFAWVMTQGPNVNWQPKARWVRDGKYFTSSGVSAGMDMALGMIELFYGNSEANRVAVRAEYDWKRDASWDPFAEIHGLA
ncbi:MAG: DJ-1/PfpI family protein [Rhodospirillales bacterium]|mgnify:FL=1|jgi:putative intracellular protease/amidase